MAEYSYVSDASRRQPNGKSKSILKHRYIWKKEFGEIPEGKIIHHKNGDKKDNRIENLEMIDRSTHSKIHWNLKKEKESSHYQ